MTKKTRTTLFVILALLFFVVAPLTIYYSLGYRFDFETKKFFQTGAFSFKVWPNSAWVFVDGKPIKKTSFLFGEVYLGNLLPKKYTIEIKKEGYFPWQKTLEIRERLATENKNIFLVPENPRFNLLGNEIDDFFPSPDGKMIILKQSNTNDWALNLLDTRRGDLSPLFEEKGFLEDGAGFLNLEWLPSSKSFLLKINGKENKYLIAELEGTPAFRQLNFLKDSADDISFSLAEPDRIFFSGNSGGKKILFTANYKNGEVSGPILENLEAFKIFDNSIFWLDEKGYINQSDFSGNRIRQFNREPFPLDNNRQYEIFVFFGNEIFLKQNDNLYFLNKERQSLEKLSEGVREVKFSSDSKKVFYFTNNEIWIMFLKDTEEQPQKEAGERLFISRFSEKIKDVFWWTNHYLIFSVGNEIKITEIDDRDKINSYTLPIVSTQVEFGTAKIFWNKYDKKLYILSQGNLFSSEELLP